MRIELLVGADLYSKLFPVVRILKAMSHVNAHFSGKFTHFSTRKHVAQHIMDIKKCKRNAHIKLLSILLPLVRVHLEHLCVLGYYQSKCDAWKAILGHLEDKRKPLPA